MKLFFHFSPFAMMFSSSKYLFVPGIACKENKFDAALRLQKNILLQEHKVDPRVLHLDKHHYESS